jgi:hypothetical protein
MSGAAETTLAAGRRRPIPLAAIMAAAAAASLLASPAAAQQQGALRRDKSLGLSLTTGVDFSSGRYGALEDTEILVVPFSLRARKGPIRISATLPWLRLDGPANIVGGGEGAPIVIDPGAPTPKRVREGFGDLSLGVDFAIPPAGLAGFQVDLGIRLKLPTSAKNRGLSTGETDIGLIADISRPVGKVSPFLTLGYRMPGDPEGFDLRNTATVSAGASVALGSLVAIGAYDYAGATSPLGFESHSLFGALAAPVAKQVTLTGYGSVGLSRGAPDYGVGLLVTFRAR